MKYFQAIIIVSLFVFLHACTTLDKLSREMQHKSESVATKPAKQNPLVPQFTIQSWSITPENPFSGAKMTSEIEIIAQTKNPTEPVQLIISRELRFGKEKIPFGRPKTATKKPGKILLSWNFTLPVDADPGTYTLATKVAFGDQIKIVKNEFDLH